MAGIAKLSTALQATVTKGGRQTAFQCCSRKAVIKLCRGPAQTFVSTPFVSDDRRDSDDQKADHPVNGSDDVWLAPEWRAMEMRVLRKKPSTTPPKKASKIPKSDEDYWLAAGMYEETIQMDEKRRKERQEEREKKAAFPQTSSNVKGKGSGFSEMLMRDVEGIVEQRKEKDGGENLIAGAHFVRVSKIHLPHDSHDDFIRCYRNEISDGYKQCDGFKGSILAFDKSDRTAMNVSFWTSHKDLIRAMETEGYKMGMNKLREIIKDQKPDVEEWDVREAISPRK